MTVIHPCRPSRRYGLDPQAPATWARINPCAPTHDLVYRLRDAGGRLLYVGVTWNPRERWVKHRRKATWWREVVAVDICCFPETSAAMRHELTAIRAEAPIHNVAGVLA